MLPEQKHGLDDLFNNLHQLRIMPLTTLPNNKLVEFINIMRRIDHEVIKARMNLSTPSHSTTQKMQNLRRNNVAVLDKFNDILSECSNYLLWRKADIGLAIQEMVSEVYRVGESTLEQFSKYREEADAIIDYLRGAKANNAAQLFADDFSDQADELDGVAKKWLWSAIGCVILVISFAFWTIFVLDLNSDVYSAVQLAQVLGSKIFIMVVLFTSAIWCGNTYKALRHQVASNRHRALALRTFRAFSERASDDATRNAVLMETTRSIFSSSSSGFVPVGSAPANNPMQIIELVKQSTKSVEK